MCARSSASVVCAGRRMVELCMPASSLAAPFARTYVALAGSSPTRMTASPGVMPRDLSAAVSRATRSRTPRAIPTPSISSAGKVHRASLTNQHDLYLTGILQLGLDATGDLVAQRRHTVLLDVVGRDDDAHLAPRLDREDFLDTAVARGDSLETLEALHVGLEGFAARAGSRARDCVSRLNQHGDLALVGHVVVVSRNAIHHE